MKPKQSFYLLGAVVVIVAAIAVYEWVYKPRQVEKEEAAEVFFPNLDPLKATKIEIRQGDTAVTLVRGGDTAWKVETAANYPADYDAIKALLDNLQQVKGGVLASTTKANFEKLGVGDKGLRLKVSQADKVVADLFVGIPGKSYGTTFIRKADSDKVYLVAVDLKVEKTNSAWRNKMIVSAPLEQVAEVKLLTWPEGTVKPGDSTAQVMRIKRNATGDGWDLVVAGNTVEKLDPGKADALVRSLASLRAVEFADQVTPMDAGIEPPQRKALLILKSGQTITLLVGKTVPSAAPQPLPGQTPPEKPVAEANSQYYVKRLDSPVITIVYNYAVTNIFQTREALLPLPGGPTFNPGSMLPAPPLGTPPAGPQPGFTLPNLAPGQNPPPPATAPAPGTTTPPGPVQTPPPAPGPPEQNPPPVPPKP